MIADLGPILRSLARRKSVFALVVAELASGFTVISCLLLVCSWYLHIGKRPSGHDEADLIQVKLQRPALGAGAGDAAGAGRARARAEMDRLRQVDGVSGVAEASSTMLDAGWDYPTRVLVDRGPTGQTPQVFAWTVRSSDDLPRVLGLRAIEGRIPAPGETAGQLLISRCLRDRLFRPGQPAVGARLLSEDVPPAKVAAVIDDVQMRMPFMQDGHCAAFHFQPPLDDRLALYLVRVHPGQRQEVVGRLRQLLGSGHGSLQVSVIPFDPAQGIHIEFTRGLIIILAIMGVVVGLLALLGALAVSSFLVAERTRQIGIRRALGATRGDVIRYFLVENALATLLGTVVGLVVTLGLYLVMRRVFIGIELDPKLLALTGALLWIDATLAAMVPARRAAEIPPSVASRAASAA